MYRPRTGRRRRRQRGAARRCVPLVPGAYEDFAEELALKIAQLHRLKDGSVEVGVLKRLVRRFLGDVRRLALAQTIHGAAPPAATGAAFPTTATRLERRTTARSGGDALRSENYSVFAVYGK